MRRASWRLPVAAVAFCLAYGLLPGAAVAASLLCYPRDDLLAGLEGRYGEMPAFAGVTADGKLFEVLVGADGSFTALLSLPEGLACPLAAGEGWRPMPRRAEEPAT
jgi:hypothetical protein